MIEKLKSEDTHFKLTYLRLKNPSIKGQRGFSMRNRSVDDVQKDLELSNLKHRYKNKEFDCIEYNRRVSYLMHDYGNKIKK